MLKKDSLKKAFKIFILFVFVTSCDNPSNPIENNNHLFDISKSTIGTSNYWKLYTKINDSINIWKLNKLSTYDKYNDDVNYYFDSLICINSKQNRFIGSILESYPQKEANSDGIKVFYGEKINSQWYFFDGHYILVPRETFKGHNMHTPLSYEQLHQAALKNVYGGYLLPNGKINEFWFKGHFEGIGWGDFKNQGPQNDWYLKGRRFKTEKEFYEAMHLDNVRNNWYGINKDSIKPLPKKELP